MHSLDIQEASDLTHCREDLQAIRMHGYVTITHGIVRIDILIPRECLIQHTYITLDHGAILKGINVAGMQYCHAGACLGAGSIAGHTFTILGHLIRGATAHAGAIVLQQMPGTLTHTGRSIGVLALWVGLQLVAGWVVLAHGWTLLLAHTVIEEILARQAILLRGSRTAAGTEQMATVSRPRAKAASLGALWGAGDLAELLAIVWTLTPAGIALARGIALGARAFQRCEVIRVVVVVVQPRQNLTPDNRSRVTQIIIVEEAHPTLQYITQFGHLQCVHLRVCGKQGIFLILHSQAEQRAATYDLKSAQEERKRQRWKRITIERSSLLRSSQLTWEILLW